MSLTDVIAAFASGTYTVTRGVAGTTTNGRYTAGATSTFTITATIQPATGRDLKLLAAGNHGEEMLTVYATTALQCGPVPDVVTYSGESWKTVNVRRWEAFGGTHYVALIARMATP